MTHPTEHATKSNLSGFWTGVYDYRDASMDAVPFNAVLTEAAGAVTGEVVEPNTFCSDATPEVFASLDGDREGERVSFVKRYEDRPGAGHIVRYEGVADAKLETISGTWAVGGDSGPFVMNRSEGGVSATIEAMADAPR